MEKQFLLMTANGTTPPRYTHNNLDDAIAEAKRLHEQHNTDVKILMVVGVVKKEQVPVTKLETVVKMQPFLLPDDNDDLPF